MSSYLSGYKSLSNMSYNHFLQVLIFYLQSLSKGGNLNLIKYNKSNCFFWVYTFVFLTSKYCLIYHGKDFSLMFYSTSVIVLGLTVRSLSILR